MAKSSHAKRTKAPVISRGLKLGTARRLRNTIRITCLMAKSVMQTHESPVITRGLKLVLNTVRQTPSMNSSAKNFVKDTSCKSSDQEEGEGVEPYG